MGEYLDRELQRELLHEYRQAYPETILVNLSGSSVDRRRMVNISYLIGHGLLEGDGRVNSLGDRSSRWKARITARGLDFLADDGGLSAILGVVTVRFDDETLRALLIDRLQTDVDADPAMTAKLKDSIKGLPAEGLKIVMQKALEAGLSNIPDLTGWLHGIVIRWTG
jgi:hypothetical protein